MNDNINILNKLFSPSVFSNFKRERFSAGSIVSHHDNKDVFVVIKGAVHGVRYYDKNEFIAPYIFSEGEIFGFYGNHIMKDTQFEFRASTDLEVIVIPESIITEVVLNDFALYKFFNESSAKIWSEIIKAIYIKFHGGSKAIFAFYLAEHSKEGKLYFLKTENFPKSMNISRIMFFKIEKEFIEKGLIKKMRKHYQILDLEELQAYYKNLIYFD